MIEFAITKNAGKHELARVKIVNLETTTDPSIGDYQVQIALDTGEGVAIYQRAIHAFPRKNINVLGLVKAALDSLSEEELHLDADPDSSHPPNLAGRLGRIMRAL